MRESVAPQSHAERKASHRGQFPRGAEANRCPGKTSEPLGGKPLLAWSIEVARQVSEIDRIIVSTDDRPDCLGGPGLWRRSVRAPGASCD